MKAEGQRKAEWEEPRMTLVGDVAEVVQGGGGKISTAAADSGDTLKPSGQVDA